jgi:hypothetical protein
MSRAGQYNFTGISDEADIALFYLLRVSKRSDFQKIIIEGKEWEDFTLVFDTHNEDYEVKSYKKPLSFYDIRKVVRKKLNKQYGEKDKFKIVVRKLNKKFRDCYEYVHAYIHWIEAKGLKKDSTAKEFLDKRWLEDEVLFLARVEIVEFNKIENIHRQLSEYFAFEYPFYLDLADQKSIIAQFFRDILERGKSGRALTQKDIRDKLVSFEKHIADCPTSFDPILSIGKRILNLREEFLTSQKKLGELNRKTYLAQLTAHPRLIFYLSDELEKGNFHVDDFKFFIDKILLKQHYVRLAIRILEKKWTQNKVYPQYLIDFIANNYTKLSDDLNYYEALRILKEIARKDQEGRFEQKIIDFLKKAILMPFTKERKKRFQRNKKGWGEDEQVAEILKIFLDRTKYKRDYTDFIFDYFDFTSDDFSNVIETHPIVYSLVKDFIKEDIKINFDYVIRKISGQFDIIYNGKYKGYEWMGAGISQAGSTYSIADKGIVRLLFEPLFMELYQSNPKGAWRFFEDRILNRAKVRATKNTPIYLKRALIRILLDRLEKEELTTQEKSEIFDYLKNILKMKKGIPETSEIIFDKICRRDLNKIGFEKVMSLIEIDSFKYRRKDYPAGYPTNLFVISTLINLIKAGYKQAKDFYLGLIRKPDFVKHDQHYDSFEQMVAQGLPESDPDFIVEIFNNIDFEKYLDNFEKDFVWDKSGLISGLIKKDWQDNRTRGQQIITTLLKDKTPSKKVLEFLAGPITGLSQHNPMKTYELLRPYLQDKKSFWQTFQNNSYARESIVSMAEELVKNEHCDQAKHIVNLCIDDPDPETDEKSEFNYHIKVKNGEKENLITSVRGKLSWVIQRFAITNEPELMEYAFEKTKILLDLDGALAKKLGYSEPDLYVRAQALVPLIELSHPWRRKRLNEYKNGLGNAVKRLAFDVVDITDKQFKSKEASPKSIMERLVSVFSNIRDLNIEEAKRILKFFEDCEEIEAHFLFIYFAEFNQDISFDSTFFKEKLKEMCLKRNPFRGSFSLEFWGIAENDHKEKTTNFEKTEEYWKLLFEDYQKEVFDDLYRTLEITLTWDNRYETHRALLEKAFDKEINYYKSIKEPVQLWEPAGEIFQVLKERSDDDFLEVFFHLVRNLNENIHYFWIKDWISLFKSIKRTTKNQERLCNKISTILRDLYPEEMV